MTGLIRQRLDDDFPEFIQNIAQLLFPHFLRPMPCMTIMQYVPQMLLEDAITIPAGSEFAAGPLNGQRVLFRASFPVTIEPVELVSTQRAGGGTQARTLRIPKRYTGAPTGRMKTDRDRKDVTVGTGGSVTG